CRRAAEQARGDLSSDGAAARDLSRQPSQGSKNCEARRVVATGLHQAGSGRERLPAFTNETRLVGFRFREPIWWSMISFRKPVPPPDQVRGRLFRLYFFRMARLVSVPHLSQT